MWSKLNHKVSELKAELHYWLETGHHSRHLSPLPREDQQIVEELKQEGVAITSLETLGLESTPVAIAAAEHYLQEMKAMLAKQTAQPNFGTIQNPAFPHIFTVRSVPEFDQWGREPRLLKLVEAYIGVPVAFQGVHLRRDFANENPVTTELWHKDSEDRRMVKIFVYLSDATEEYGPLEYIPRRLVSPWLKRRIQKTIHRLDGRLGLTNGEMAQFVPESRWKSCSVPAGSVVFADPVAIFHHGKARQQERSALFFVYTAAQPLRPECVTQYWDDTFYRPSLTFQPVDFSAS